MKFVNLYKMGIKSVLFNKNHWQIKKSYVFNVVMNVVHLVNKFLLNYFFHIILFIKE